jgi:hypothetical protein
MKVVVETRPWRAALFIDEGTPEFDAEDWVRFSLPVAKTTLGTPRQYVAEVYFHASSIVPRCVVGGTYVPGGEVLEIEVGVTSAPPKDELASAFWRPYSSHLTSEFAPDVAKSIKAEAARFDLRGGALTINVAGIDAENSSSQSFNRAVQVLLWSMQFDDRINDLSTVELENFTKTLTIR